MIPFFERRPTATPVPLLVSIPHTGTEIPVDISLRLAPGVSAVADTDWHLHHLYDFAPELGAHTIYARFGRAVADLNRPAEGGALYPGRDETTVVPTSTFGGERLYAEGKEPTATEIEERLQTVWRPYHVRIICDAPRKLAAAVVELPSVDAVHVDPDGAVVVLSRNVLDLQVELPRLAQAASISLRRVEPLDDSLESVFGYLVEA